MSDEILLDLGEFGSILVEPVTSPEAAPAKDGRGIVPAGRVGDRARTMGRQVKVKAEEVLKLPLAGLGRCFVAALPDSLGNDEWQLDAFSVEFGIGLEAQVGTNLGAVAIVAPNGGFKCTYTWSRRARDPISASG